MITGSPDEGSRLTHPLIRAGLTVGARRVADARELVAELRQGAPGGLPWDLVVCAAEGGPGGGVAGVAEAIRSSDREASLVAVALPGTSLTDGMPADVLVLPAGAPSEEVARRVRRASELAAMRRTARAATPTGDLRDHALASMDQAVVIADAAQQGFPTVYVNPAFERMTGWAQSQILGQSCAVLQGPDTDPQAVAELAAALAEGRPASVTLLNVRRDGTPFWNRVALTPIRDRDDSVRHVLAVLADVTDEVAANARLVAARRDNARLREGLSEAELRYRELVERTPAVTYVAEFDEIGTVRYMSPQVEELLGYPPEAFLPPSELWYDLVHPDDRDRVLAEATRVFREGREYECEFRMVAADGRLVHVWERDSIIRDEAGEPLFTQGVVVDISALRRAEAEVRDERDRAQTYLDVAGATILVLDRHGKVVLLNRTGHDLLRYVEGELSGRSWLDLCVADRDREKARAVFEQLVAGRLEPSTRTLEHAVVTKDGVQRELLWHNTVLRDEHGEVSATLSSGIDVTDRRLAEDRIAHLAYHDALTDLPNRALLGEHLELAIARAQRSGRGVALLSLDLDDFKLVNDAVGHPAGDVVLLEVAGRLAARRRAGDLLARPAGDEFLLLIADVDGDAEAVAQSAAEGLLEALRAPARIADHQFELGASVGISVFPQDAHDAQTLLRHADAAMYQAKAAGRGGIRAWSDDGASPLQRLSARARLRRAIDADELLLHFQPIVDPAGGGLACVEALVRWEDPERGLVAPGDFVGVAEQYGLIDDLGRWVLRAVCAQKAAWRAEGVDPVVAINTSLHELQRDDFAHGLLDQLDRHGLDPAGVVVELTESTVMGDRSRVAPQIHALADAGVRIAIDDLGSGASSLARLQELPVQLLKLDRSFLSDVPEREQSGALVRALVDLSAALDTVLVVEGVETEEQRAFLADAGCPLAQGYLLGRPAPAASLTGLLRAAAPARR